MRLTKFQYLGLMAIGMIIVLVALILFTEKTVQSELSNKEKIVIDTLFDKVKPQCIGRYVIDVPESFNNQLNSGKYIDDFKIESKFIYPPAFKQRIQLRERELREWNPGVENAPALKEIIQLPDDKGVIFDRNQSGSDDAYRTLEAHVYINHIAFIITTDILDLSAPKYADEKRSYIEVSGFSEADTNTRSIKLAAMQSLASRLSGRLDHEIPTEKGICIPNGFIQDDQDKHNNNIYFLYENNDFRISINTGVSNQDPNDTLFNRESEGRKILIANNKKTIRINEVKLSNINAQEWLINGVQSVYNEIENKNMLGQPYYYFKFETLLPTSPLLSISMNNIEQETQYSDAAMIEIWDRIISSVRYRPNAF